MEICEDSFNSTLTLVAALRSVAVKFPPPPQAVFQGLLPVLSRTTKCRNKLLMFPGPLNALVAFLPQSLSVSSCSAAGGPTPWKLKISQGHLPLVGPPGFQDVRNGHTAGPPPGKFFFFSSPCFLLAFFFSRRKFVSSLIRGSLA